MEEMSRFRNEVRQAGQKRDKREGRTKIDSHKLDKRHKLDKADRSKEFYDFWKEHNFHIPENSTLEIFK